MKIKEIIIEALKHNIIKYRSLGWPFGSKNATPHYFRVQDKHFNVGTVKIEGAPRKHMALRAAKNKGYQILDIADEDEFLNRLPAHKLNSILEKGPIKATMKPGVDTYQLWPAGKGYQEQKGENDPTLHFEKVKTHHRLQLILGHDPTFFKKDMPKTFGIAPIPLEIGEQSLQLKKEKKLAEKISTHLTQHGVKHHFAHDEDNFPMIYVPVQQ